MEFARPSGRSPRRGLLAVVAAAPALACVSRSPGPEAFLAAGHRTPEQTLDSFRNALAADVPDLEYRCLSADFRRRLGISLLSYAEARDELPFYRHVADAEVVSRRVLGPDRVEVTLCLDHVFGEEWFRVELVREGFWELWDGDRLGTDGLARFADHVRVEEGPSGARVSAEVRLGPGALPPEVTELRIGQDWKIDGFERLADPAPD